MLQSAWSGSQSAPAVVAIAIPRAASGVQTAASTVATSVSAAVEIVPRNCSIGTRQYCVGFDYAVSCNPLPLDLLRIVSPDIQRLLHIDFDDLWTLNLALRRVTTSAVHDSMLAGLASPLVMTVGVVCWAMGYLRRVASSAPPSTKAVIVSTTGLVACIPFLLAVMTLQAVRVKGQQLPSWVRMQEGEVYKLGMGSFVSALLVVALSSGAVLLAR